MAHHLICKALAGTGKTTTAVTGVQVLQGQTPQINPSPQQFNIWQHMAGLHGAQSVRFCAFNKSIATELQARLPGNAQASTINSLGNAIVKRAYPQTRLNQFKTTDLLERIEQVGIRELRRDEPDYVRGVEQLTGLVKMTLSNADSEETLDGLCAYHDIQLNGDRERAYETVGKLIQASKDTAPEMIDFSDQIWLPVVKDLQRPRYDVMIVDEAQDLNRCQQELVLSSGNNIICVGDENQAIYGFAGADTESINRLHSLLAEDDATAVLPLTVTYRCGKAIVEHAKRYVPEYEAHESNGAGIVDDVSSEKLLDVVQPGDFILCRTNAPLASYAFRLLAAGKACHIQGRDIGQQLVSFIKKMSKQGMTTTDDVDAMLDRAELYIERELQREAARKNPSEAKQIALQDKIDCVRVLCEGSYGVTNVCSKIEGMFANQSKGGIVLSSCHRAKGLEARRVFIIEPQLLPHPMAKSPWQQQQEHNLAYVAVTRAIEHLTYVFKNDV